MRVKAPRHQQLPASGREREALRAKGQFWTPGWVAEAMVAYGAADGAETVFDPAVGGGAFFCAAKVLARETRRSFKFAGCELHPEVLEEAVLAGLNRDELAAIQHRDFVLHPPDTGLACIVANPPYVRHHRVPQDVKAQLREFGARLLGRPLDGRAGFHVYFLLRALTLLAPGGRLAFVMPADTCEGVFAQPLWRWITKHFRLEAAVTFKPEATPFPGVDTNALVFFIRNEPPVEDFYWVSCSARGDNLKNWVLSGFTAKPSSALVVVKTGIVEAVRRGLSRVPVSSDEGGATLLDFANVVRGIATGANEFFHLTRAEAQKLDLPARWLVPAVGRTRDIPNEVITRGMLDQLEEQGRPTLLLALDATPYKDLPKPVQAYVRRGEEQGLPQRSLIASRRPWYRMEVRKVPSFLFAYLGRRNARFIRNEANVVPLTGFLCIYPRDITPAAISALWNVLRHPDTIAGLSSVGKSYGGGAVKVEPRGLERLPLPHHVLQAFPVLSGREQLTCL